MKPERYFKLNNEGHGLTYEESEAGWHFCDEWDGLLIGPDMRSEWSNCICNIKKQLTKEN